MIRTITLQLADGTTRPIQFKACGTTAIRYRQVFGKELLGCLTGIINSAGPDGLARLLAASQAATAAGEDTIDVNTLDPETLQVVLNIGGSGQLDTISKLAYIMARSAEGAAMGSLSVEDYLDWLDQFESMEFLTRAMDFISLYMGNRETTSSAKKNTAQPIAR